MKDYVVEVLYQTVDNETQQDLFEVSAISGYKAKQAVIKILQAEYATITYMKVKEV